MKYRPSNGTEGAAFIDEWCGTCKKDKEMSEAKPFLECSDDEICSILTNTFCYTEESEYYPIEWVITDDGPKCTAHSPIDKPYRCDKTEDMFSEDK